MSLTSYRAAPPRGNRYDAGAPRGGRYVASASGLGKGANDRFETNIDARAPRSRSLRQIAAIDRQDVAGGHRGGGAGEEQDRGGDLFGLDQAAHRRDALDRADQFGL